MKKLCWVLTQMNNSQFLLWLSDSIVNIYGESENIDFVLKLRELASEQSEPPKVPLTNKQELIRDLLSRYLIDMQLDADNIPNLVHRFNLLVEEILK